MFRYWIKNRSLVSLFLFITLAVINIFVFFKPNIQTEADNLLLTSVYKNSDISYDIPSPTKEQLAKIKNLEFVDDVFGYYYTEGTVKFNKYSRTTKLLFSDMMDSLSFTMYNNKRLISSKEGLSNPIYIDYEFSKVNNVELGDELVYDGIKFEVGRIYQTNEYFNSILFVPLVGEQKELIESKIKSYSGAFLKCNDDKKTENYLRNYKPEGRLKDRSEFKTEEQYQIHYNAWYETNYFNEIISFKEKLSSVNTKTAINYLYPLIIQVIIISTFYVLISIRKSELAYFIKKQEKKSILSYYSASITFDFILSLLVVLGSILISKILVTEYISSCYLKQLLISGFISSIALLIIELTFSLFLFRSKITKVKN